MSPQDINNFKKALNILTESFAVKEKFLVGPLAVKLKQAAQTNPGDAMIIGMASFLEKRASKEHFITRAELNTVFQKLYVAGSHCEDYLGKELGREEIASGVKKVAHFESENKEIFSGIDKNLVSSLEGAFENKKVAKDYSEELGTKAAYACLRELNKLSFKPKKVSTSAGNTDVIIISASYETPKGECSVLVPVEVAGDKALSPTCFVAAAGFKDITEENVKDYIVASAGIKLQANLNNILNLAKVAKYGLEERSEIEEIVLRASARNETPASYDANGIFLTIAPEAKELNTKADAKEVSAFAARLASDSGKAEFLFGKEALDKSKALILKTVKAAGARNPQVKISSFDEKTVYFLVAASNGGIKVPVKIENGKAEVPTIAMAAGTISSFDVEGITKLMSQDDKVLAAQASSLSGAKPAQLIEVVIKAAQAGDHEVVEEALNILDQSDKVAFASAVELYKDILSGKFKTAEISKCSHEVSSPNSIHKVCAHTGLPVNKVYQDAHGNCHSKARQHEEKTSQAASFMHSSVFFKGN